MPTPEGSNHHSHENPTFIHDPEEVKYSAVSSAVAPCSPSLRSALRAKPRREVEESSFFPKTLSYIKENFHTLYTFFFKHIFAIKIHFKNIQSRIFDAPQ